MVTQRLIEFLARDILANRIDVCISTANNVESRREEKWLRKSDQGDKWNRCLIEGMIVLSETGARDEQTTPP